MRPSSNSLLLARRNYFLTSKLKEEARRKQWSFIYNSFDDDVDQSIVFGGEEIISLPEDTNIDPMDLDLHP